MIPSLFCTTVLWHLLACSLLSCSLFCLNPCSMLFTMHTMFRLIYLIRFHASCFFLVPSFCHSAARVLCSRPRSHSPFSIHYPGKKQTAVCSCFFLLHIFYMHIYPLQIFSRISLFYMISERRGKRVTIESREFYSTGRPLHLNVKLLLELNQHIPM